jgi:hypothetical protein
MLQYQFAISMAVTRSSSGSCLGPSYLKYRHMSHNTYLKISSHTCNCERSHEHVAVNTNMLRGLMTLFQQDNHAQYGLGYKLMSDTLAHLLCRRLRANFAARLVLMFAQFESKWPNNFCHMCTLPEAVSSSSNRNLDRFYSRSTEPTLHILLAQVKWTAQHTCRNPRYAYLK